jgi:hypothetical protein
MTHRFELALVCAVAALCICCDRISDTLSEDPADIVSLTVSPDTIPADGESVAMLEARVAAGFPAADRVVTFSTSAGAFVTGDAAQSQLVSVDADINGIANMPLRAPLQAGSAVVRAKASTFVREVQVTFTRALPERVDVAVDESVLRATSSDTAAVVATLLRATGMATEQTFVDFSATSPEGSLVGGFSNVTPSDSTGRATALFGVSPATSFRGFVAIRATVRDAVSGAVVEGETNVEIVD